MRQLWSDDVATFRGEFTSFDAVRVNPKPVHGRRIPVIVGGNSDAALGRVAAFGDGWYGFNLTAAQATGRIPLDHRAGCPLGPARRAIASGARHRAAIVPWWWNICHWPGAVRRHSEVRLDRLP